MRPDGRKQERKGDDSMNNNLCDYSHSGNIKNCTVPQSMHSFYYSAAICFGIVAILGSFHKNFIKIDGNK